MEAPSSAMLPLPHLPPQAGLGAALPATGSSGRWLAEGAAAEAWSSAPVACDHGQQPAGPENPSPGQHGGLTHSLLSPPGESSMTLKNGVFTPRGQDPLTDSWDQEAASLTDTWDPTSGY